MIGSSSHRRRRKRDGRYIRAIKKHLRRVYRHPLFPRQPITIVRVFLVQQTVLLTSIPGPDTPSPLGIRRIFNTFANIHPQPGQRAFAMASVLLRTFPVRSSRHPALTFGLQISPNTPTGPVSSTRL
jgi:hypothetical protein